MATHSTAAPTNNWDLSLYELHRKPHEMVMDSTTIAVSPRALHSELMCPICLDLMKNTQTTKECLHRFCQDCIITALRSGNKECPTCRKKLVSKRSLRPDPNFDRLIEKIYPNRNEVSAQDKAPKLSSCMHQHQRRKRKATDSPTSAESSEQLSADPKRPATVDRSFSTEPDQTADSPPTSTPVPTPPSITSSQDGKDARSGSTGMEEIELQIRPHPLMMDFAIRNLSTTPDATVSHLLKYLTLYQVEKQEKFNVICTQNLDETKDESKCNLYMLLNNNGEDDFTVLPAGTSLRQICDNYWTPGEKLKLYFAIDREMTSS